MAIETRDIVAPCGTLSIPADILAALRNEASRRYPAEACGFLLGSLPSEVPGPAADPRSGSTPESTFVVRSLRGERNQAQRRDRFFIDATDVFAAMRAARETGDEIVAVYHSHPDGVARPSDVDRREAWGEWLHVIVECRDGVAGKVTAWRLRGETFVPLRVKEPLS